MKYLFPVKEKVVNLFQWMKYLIVRDFFVTKK